MTFSFHPEAESEFDTANDDYDNCGSDFGYDLSVEVFATLQNIVNFQAAWPVVEEGVWHCIVNRFPYGVVYSIEQDEVFILAAMHLRHRPDCWTNRYSIGTTAKRGHEE